MEKLFTIAGGITNPYSLIALAYLILFVLFKGVLLKVAPQTGQRGYKVLMRFMTLVAGVAVLTLLSVLGYKAYAVYAGTRVVAADVNQHTDASVAHAVQSLESPDLQVAFAVRDFMGASVLIGNQGQGIVLVSDIALDWSYKKCPKLTEPTIGAPVVTYRYAVDLTQSDGSKILDPREFKYGPGEVDNFLVDLKYPGHGIYTLWMSFTHKTINEQTSHAYTTAHVEHDECSRD